MARAEDIDEAAEWILAIFDDPRTLADQLIDAEDEDGTLEDFNINYDAEVELRSIGLESVHEAAKRRAEDNNRVDNAGEQLMRWLYDAPDGHEHIDQFRWWCKAAVESNYINDE